MDDLQNLVPLLDTAGSVATVLLVGWLVITRKLIWYKDLDKVEKKCELDLEIARAQRDRWENVALEALGVAGKLTIQGEVTTEVLTSLPDPALDGKHSGGTT